MLVALRFSTWNQLSQMHYIIPHQKQKGHEGDCFVVTGGVAIYPLTAPNTFGNVALTTPTLRCRVDAGVITFIPILLKVSVLPRVWIQIARFMARTWVLPGSCRPQVGPVWAPRTLLSGKACYGLWFKGSIASSLWLQGPLLLTWIDFYPSMDK